MGITDRIAEILERMLEEEGGMLVIRRNDFAAKVGCVPSQINYVIS
jgi:transcriptional regulator CtsR